MGKNRAIRSAVLICLCFLLTSMGWLSWEYHLLSQAAPRTSDICTMIAGYLLQAAGIGLFALLLRRRPQAARRCFCAALPLHLVFMAPAVLSPYSTGTLIFGFLMNLSCGVIAGYYLYDLARNVDGPHKAAAFGAGYGAAILVQWILSLTVPSLYYSGYVLIFCLLLTGAAFFTDRTGKEAGGAAEGEHAAGSVSPGLLRPVCLLVLLFSVVNGSGFAFPSADLGGAVSVELFRLIYAAGLIIAGAVTDRNRKYGAMCALIALLLPFIILALRGQKTAAAIFWGLSYFAFGFYAVYRIVVFSDLAAEKKAFWLSGFGLMIGRVGDAVGEALCLALEHRMIGLICLSAALFAATVLVFFRVYHLLYVPEYRQEQSEKERFFAFAAQHDLSAREREIMTLLLEGKTNKEIGDGLFISENTVKFHVRNLLQKTGCRNRNELIMSYMGKNET